MIWKPQISLRSFLVCAALIGPLVYFGHRGWSAYRLARETGIVMGMVERMARSGRYIAEPVQDGQVVLVQKGNAVGAFVSERHGMGWVRYRWYYRTDGKGHFDKNDSNVHTGTTLETRTYLGDDRYVRFGPFKVEWSRAHMRWGWVFYDSGGTKTPYRLCFTNKTRFRGLDALHPRWRYKINHADPGCVMPPPSQEAPAAES